MSNSAPEDVARKTGSSHDSVMVVVAEQADGKFDMVLYADMVLTVLRTCNFLAPEVLPIGRRFFPTDDGIGGDRRQQIAAEIKTSTAVSLLRDLVCHSDCVRVYVVDVLEIEVAGENKKGKR